MSDAIFESKKVSKKVSNFGSFRGNEIKNIKSILRISILSIDMGASSKMY